MLDRKKHAFFGENNKKKKLARAILCDETGAMTQIISSIYPVDSFS